MLHARSGPQVDEQTVRTSMCPTHSTEHAILCSSCCCVRGEQGTAVGQLGLSAGSNRSRLKVGSSPWQQDQHADAKSVGNDEQSAPPQGPSPLQDLAVIRMFDVAAGIRFDRRLQPGAVASVIESGGAARAVSIKLTEEALPPAALRRAARERMPAIVETGWPHAGHVLKRVHRAPPPSLTAGSARRRERERLEALPAAPTPTESGIEGAPFFAGCSLCFGTHLVRRGRTDQRLLNEDPASPQVVAPIEPQAPGSTPVSSLRCENASATSFDRGQDVVAEESQAPQDIRVLAAI